MIIIKDFSFRSIQRIHWKIQNIKNSNKPSLSYFSGNVLCSFFTFDFHLHLDIHPSSGGDVVHRSFFAVEQELSQCA